MGALVALAVVAAPAARADDPKPDLFPAHRLGYVAGGALALTGAAFGLVARSEASRASTVTSARESTEALRLARDHAATANLCFAMAGVTVVYALVVEFLPRPAADATSLAFRF
jgi:hypothetical protein